VKVRSLQKVICGEYQEDDQEDEEACELEELFFEIVGMWKNLKAMEPYLDKSSSSTIVKELEVGE